MNRRSFLKLAAKTLALATVAIKAPSVLASEKLPEARTGLAQVGERPPQVTTVSTTIDAIDLKPGGINWVSGAQMTATEKEILRMVDAVSSPPLVISDKDPRYKYAASGAKAYSKAVDNAVFESLKL
jgi:hypothetical protein